MPHVHVTRREAQKRKNQAASVIADAADEDHRNMKLFRDMTFQCQSRKGPRVFYVPPKDVKFSNLPSTVFDERHCQEKASDDDTSDDDAEISNDQRLMKILRDRTQECQFDGRRRNTHIAYIPPANVTLSNLESTAFDRAHCMRQYNVNKIKPIRNGLEVPAVRPFSPVGVVARVESPTAAVTRLVAERRISCKPKQRPKVVAAPKKAVDYDPSATKLTDEFVRKLVDHPGEVQELLFQYFKGNVGQTYNAKHDWTRLPGHGEEDRDLPPTSCTDRAAGTVSYKLKLHQAAAWTQMRAWVSQQGFGQDFQPQKTPKGMMVVHSTGSGKTVLAAALIQAAFDQPRHIMVFTTVSNKKDIAGEANNSKYWQCLQSMFPESSITQEGAANFHKRVEFLSFNEAGSGLGFGHNRAAKRYKGFEKKVKQAFIILDEVQELFTPLPQYKAQNEGLRTWLDGPHADGTTLVLMTATPGKDPSELFSFLNILRQSNDKLVLTEYYDDKTNSVKGMDEFKTRIAGQVSFVDFRNNTNDYPRFLTQVELVPLSGRQFEEWRTRAQKTLAMNTSSDFKTTEGKAARKYANMIGPRRSGAAGVYKSNNLEEISELSAKLVRAVKNIQGTVGKQYLYSEFNEHGVAQIAQVLTANGWTDVTAHVGSADLPGKDYYRFITTAKLATVKAGRGGGRAQTGRRGPRLASGRGRARASRQGTGHGSGRGNRSTSGRGNKSGSGRASSESSSDGRSPTADAAGDAGQSRHAQNQVTKFRKAFNAHDNLYGQQIRLMLASGTYNTGLDLEAVRAIHIFEPLTSLAAETQTVGRGRRFCSHAELPKEDREVIVTHYFSVENTDQQKLAKQINEHALEAHRATLFAHAAKEKIRTLLAELQRAAAQSCTGPFHGGLKVFDALGAIWSTLTKYRSIALQRLLKSDSSQARDAPVQVSEDAVRTALLLKQYCLERAAALNGQGVEVPAQLKIQIEMATQKAALLKELQFDSRKLKKQLASIETLSNKKKTPEQQRAMAISVLKLTTELQSKLDREMEESVKADAMAKTLRAKVLQLRKKLHPAFAQFLEKFESLEEPETVKPRGRGKRQKPAPLQSAYADDILPTDIAVHGIARLEGKPMQELMQALAGAAFDCKVLQNMHARTGVEVSCQR